METPKGMSPPKKQTSFSKEMSPPKKQASFSKDMSPPKKQASFSKEISPPRRQTSFSKETSPPKNETSPPKETSPPEKEIIVSKISVPLTKTETPQSKKEVMSPKNELSALNKAASPPKEIAPPNKSTSPPKNATPVTSPPLSALKLNYTDSKLDQKVKPQKEPPAKPERRIISNEVEGKLSNGKEEVAPGEPDVAHAPKDDDALKGVGDKIKKFEKAAEDAGAGRLSRPGSVRGRPRTERLGSDTREDFPPPATPFRDNIHFDLAPDRPPNAIERQHIMKKNNVKWQRSESSSESEKTVIKPEPQKIIKPEFKPIASPAEVTIRSPSLGGKIPEQFPSQGTAFRNVASPDASRARDLPPRDEPGDGKCRKMKEKCSVSKGSSYFTRGSEEIWLVKKKDIEAIEERVLESLRRGGGHATMRPRRQYARSESLEGGPPPRASTLRRQVSAACTCPHAPRPPRPRARSQPDPAPADPAHPADPADPAHVLDKYETLV